MDRLIPHELALTILEHIVGLLVIDEQGKISYITKSYAENLGLPQEAAIGRPVESVIYNTRLPWILQTKKEEWGQAFTSTGVLGIINSTICNRLPLRKEDRFTGPVIGALSYSAVSAHSDERTIMSELETVRHQNELLRSHLSQLYLANRELDEILGHSPQIAKVKELIQRVAHTSATVCILGETGTGKELVANAIHCLSKRAEEPFVKVNCAAIPKDLMESELFGYAPGAFTGASKQGKIGKFELANHGTLLLDEIGELPLNLQAKLLRVLQANEVERVGGTSPIPIDVRIICSTNRDLEKMVADGEFRADLYYRINVMEIKVPPLRDRPEDIHELAEHFIKKANLQHDLTISGAHPQVYRTLYSHPWPGNIRELEHAIERACILCGNGLLMPEHFKAMPPTSTAKPPAAAAAPISSLDTAERETILRALEACGGNKRRAAEALHISRSTLYLKLEKYHIST